MNFTLTANASTKQEKPSDLEVEIKPDHAFGLYTNSTQYGHPGYIRDTLGYLAESKVVHPVGQKAAMYQLDKHRMDFFELNPNVNLSMNNEYLFKNACTH